MSADTTSTTKLFIDPTASTMPFAWASSDLGQLPLDAPMHVIGAGAQDQAVDTPRRPVTGAVLATALFGGIALGLAAYIVALPAPPEPVVMVPDAGTGSVAPPAPSGISAPDTIAQSPMQVPAPGNAVPDPIAPQPEPAAPPTLGPAPASMPGPADVGASEGPTVVIDVPVPEFPTLPPKPKPEPANPGNPNPQLMPETDPPAMQPQQPPKFTTLPPKPKLGPALAPPAMGPKLEPVFQVPHKLQMPDQAAKP